MSSIKVYKSCAVPQCKTSTVTAPNKLFVFVPHNKTTRDKWLNLARRDPESIKQKSAIHFCEDHFDLPNDMENYMQYHLMGSVAQIRMKPGCVPTKFDCQKDWKRKFDGKQNYITTKQRKKGAKELGGVFYGKSGPFAFTEDINVLYEDQNKADKICQTRLSVTLKLKTTTFTCNRYIYTDRCDVEIQTEIAPKFVPIKPVEIIKQIPKIKREDKETITESKYFIISSTNYKPLKRKKFVPRKTPETGDEECKMQFSSLSSSSKCDRVTRNKGSSQISRLESEPETRHDQICELSAVKSESEARNAQICELSAVQSESETRNEQICELSAVKSESETRNEQICEFSAVQSESETRNAQICELSAVQSESETRNAQICELSAEKEQLSEVSRIKSEPDTESHILIEENEPKIGSIEFEVVSIKIEPVADINEFPEIPIVKSEPN